MSLSKFLTRGCNAHCRQFSTASLKATVVKNSHEKHGGKMVDFAGYYPVEFETI